MPPAAPASPLPHDSRHAPAPKPQQPPFTPARQQDDLDDALLKELEVSLDEQPPRNASRPKTASLDDEMTKLLGELSVAARYDWLVERAAAIARSGAESRPFARTEGEIERALFAAATAAPVRTNVGAAARGMWATLDVAAALEPMLIASIALGSSLSPFSAGNAEAPKSMTTVPLPVSSQKQVLERPPEPNASPDPTTVSRMSGLRARAR